MSITFSHAVRSQTLTFMDHLAPGDKWRAQRIFGLVRVAPENLLIMMLDICRQLAVSRGQTKWKPTESWRICACEICFVNLLNMLTSLLLFFWGGNLFCLPFSKAVVAFNTCRGIWMVGMAQTNAVWLVGSPGPGSYVAKLMLMKL